MRKYLIPILSLLLIFAAIAILVTRPVTVDWGMTAYLIAPDGTVESSIPITIDGKIQETNGRKFFTINYGVPEKFRYRFSTAGGAGDPEVQIKGLTGNDPGDTLVRGNAYDCIENIGVDCYYVYNVDLGYFMATWDNGDGSYLVAATNPDVKPVDLIAHFLPYCEALGITASE